MQTVRDQKFTITDGMRSLEIYPVQGLAHSADMLIAYLPAEKMLINADLYAAPAPGDPPPLADASMRTLFDNIRRLKLDVVRHVGIHGVPGSHEDFVKTLGTTK